MTAEKKSAEALQDDKKVQQCCHLAFFAKYKISQGRADTKALILKIALSSS
jgi:hypothetical protein